MRQITSRRLRLSLSAALLALCTALPAFPAMAQSNDMRELLNRLGRLETEVQTLSREVYRGGGNRPSGGGSAPAALSPSIAGDFEVRLQRLEADVATMTGRYEEATFQIGQLREQLERLASDIDFRLSALEGRGPGGAGGTGAMAAAPLQPSGSEPVGEALPPMQQQAAAPSAATLPTGNPQQQYDMAFGMLRQQDYAGAERAFRQFLSDNNGHALSANAQYWLGETLYVRNMFKEAAVAFAEGYQTYPKSNKAADSLLKLAMSLGNINQREDACLAIEQLRSQFRDAPTTVKRRADQERSRLKCG